MLYSLSTVAEELKPYHKFFIRSLPNPALLTSKFHELLNGNSVSSKKLREEILKKPIDAFMILRTSREKFPLIIRPDKEKTLHEYGLSHLRSSIIKNMLLREGKRDDFLLLLYYTAAFNKKEDEDLVRWVCTEIEEIIKIIITKELTLYKNANTAEIIKNLRRWITGERLLGATTVRPSVNFRR